MFTIFLTAAVEVNEHVKWQQKKIGVENLLDRIVSREASPGWGAELSNSLALISQICFPREHEILKHFALNRNSFSSLSLSSSLRKLWKEEKFLSLNARNLYTSTVGDFFAQSSSNFWNNELLRVKNRKAFANTHSQALSYIQQISHPLSTINLYFLPLLSFVMTHPKRESSARSSGKALSKVPPAREENKNRREWLKPRTCWSYVTYKVEYYWNYFLIKL